MSNKKKLSSEEVKQSIKHLLREARICAETEVKINTDQEKGVLGFAAMLTIFPIMISISEAIIGKHSRNRKTGNFIKDFATKMKSDDLWLIKSPSSPQNLKHDTLVKVRNGLAKEMSLPPRVLLTKDAAQAKIYWDPSKYDCVIGIKEFIDEVERTAFRLVNDAHYSVKDFDPAGTQGFGLLDTIPPPSATHISGVISAASQQSTK